MQTIQEDRICTSTGVECFVPTSNGQPQVNDEDSIGEDSLSQHVGQE